MAEQQPTEVEAIPDVPAVDAPVANDLEVEVNSVATEGGEDSVGVDCDEFVPSDDDDAANIPDDHIPGYEYIYCPLNAGLVQKWCNSLAFRQLKSGVNSYSDILGAQLKRIVPKKDLPAELKALPNKFWTLDRYGKAKVPAQLGLNASWEGSPDVRGDDPRLAHERVQGCLRGLTIFAGPKALRLLCRSGTGLKTVDIVNSHPVHVMMAMTPEEKAAAPELAAYASDRTTCFAILKESLMIPTLEDSELKQLVLSIMYGGGLRKQLSDIGYFGDPPAWLSRFRDCVHSRAKHLSVCNPEQRRALKEDFAKDQPEISLLSYHALAAQHDTCEKMAATITHGRIAGWERDCIVLTDKRDAILAAAAAGVPTKIEDYPNEADIVRLLKQKHPFVDFEIESEFSWDDVAVSYTHLTLPTNREV